VKRFTARLMVLLLIGVVSVACAGKGGLSNAPGGATATPVSPATLSAPRGKILMGIDATYPPFETVDYGKRELIGFDVDLIRAIAGKAGLEVEFANIGLDQVLAGVTRCQYDGGISAIAITDVLKQRLSFSEPYFAFGQVVVVKKGNVVVTGRAQLSGMAVGAQQGSPSAAEISKIAGAQLKTYRTFDLAFQDLMQGLIDAVIAERPLALNYVSTPANDLKIVGEEFAVVSYGIAVCTQKAELLKTVNDGLAAVKADGTLDALAKKWRITP
jgi:polar amino acid transport system substrate-binding protein